MFPSKCLSLCVASLAMAGLSFAQAPAGDEVKPVAAPAKSAAKPAKVTLSVTMRDGLRFEPPRMTANPGDEITVRLENADTTHQTHNFLVLKPGKLREVVTQAMELGDKGPAAGFVPPNPDILVHSAVLDPDKEATVTFKLPPEPGIYPYVCTFPGHGMIMYGALYSGVKPPPIDKDPNIPPTSVQLMIAGGGRRPFVQRMFMPDATPAAIAIALPGMQNVVWDATQCRLRYAWMGAFIDASAYWKGNGREIPKLSAPPWWKAAADQFPLRFGAATSAAPAVHYLGYTIKGGLPEFHYRAGDTEVFEKIEAGPTHDSIALHFRIPQALGAVSYLVSGQAKASASVGEIQNGVLTLTAAQAADFTLTLSSAQ